MYKQILRAIAIATATVYVSVVLTGCTTVGPRLRSDTGYGSTTIPTDHSEALRASEIDRENAKEREKLTPEERRALVEYYKEMLSDI